MRNDSLALIQEHLDTIDWSDLDPETIKMILELGSEYELLQD